MLPLPVVFIALPFFRLDNPVTCEATAISKQMPINILRIICVEGLKRVSEILERITGNPV
jgi:hypothetical protein